MAGELDTITTYAGLKYTPWVTGTTVGFKVEPPEGSDLPARWISVAFNEVDALDPLDAKCYVTVSTTQHDRQPLAISAVPLWDRQALGVTDPDTQS